MGNLFSPKTFTAHLSIFSRLHCGHVIGLQRLRRMAPKVGLEPIGRPFSAVSLLLIIAFLCANLPANIQAFPSYSKHYFASLCNCGQKKLCGNMRLCGNCAAGKFCAGTVRARWPLASPRYVGRAGLGVGCLEPLEVQSLALALRAVARSRQSFFRPAPCRRGTAGGAGFAPSRFTRGHFVAKPILVKSDVSGP